MADRSLAGRVERAGVRGGMSAAEGGLCVGEHLADDPGGGLQVITTVPGRRRRRSRRSRAVMRGDGTGAGSGSGMSVSSFYG
jgi:hypothetical protein